MLHGRNHSMLWMDGANDYKASYSTQQNFAKPIWQPSQQFGGNGSNGSGQGGGAQDGGVQATYSWPKATPLFADGIFMQTMEPEEIVHAGPTHLLPMPSPVAPSTNEIMHALMRRKRLEEERKKHQEALQARLKANRRQTADEEVTEATSSEAEEPQDAAAKPQDVTSPEEHDSANVEQEGCDGGQEEQEESRLVLPVLESLIALRRRRLNAGQLPSYPQQNPTKLRQAPQVSTSGSAWAPNNNTNKTAPTRRNGTSTTTRAPTETSASSKEPPSPAAAKQLNAPMTTVSLSQFPGPWRATRKWTSPSEVSASNTASGPATAPITLQDTSTSGTTGPNAKAPATVSGAARSGAMLTPVVSLAGHEVALGASSAQSFTAAVSRPATTPTPFSIGLRAGGVGSAPNPRYVSRFSPATGNAVGVNSQVLSGVGSGDVAEPVEPLGCSVNEQRQLLREWQQWRRRSGLMVPGETDSESGEGDCDEGEEDADYREEGDEVEMEHGEGQQRRLFEKANGVLSATTVEIASRPVLAARGVPQGASAVAEYQEGDGDEAEGAEVYEEGVGGGAGNQGAWHRTRRITQCFDIPGVPSSPGADSTAGPAAAPCPPTTPAVTATRPGPPMSSSSGPLSPMASRRAGRHVGAVRASKSFGGSIGLPIWLQRAFGGGRGGGAGSSAPDTSPATAGSKASGGGVGSVQSPEAVVVRGPSQTTGSSFTKSQGGGGGGGRTARMQSTSSGQLLIPSEASPAVGAAITVTKPRVQMSSDGRGSLGGGASSLDAALGSMLAVRASPVRPPGTPGATASNSPQLEPAPIAVKGHTRSSLDSSVAPRAASRTVTDSSVRAASQGKVRFSSEPYVAPVGSLPESPLAQLLVTNSFDRRRGDRVASSMFPKVKLL